MPATSGSPRVSAIIMGYTRLRQSAVIWMASSCGPLKQNGIRLIHHFALACCSSTIFSDLALPAVASNRRSRDWLGFAQRETGIHFSGHALIIDRRRAGDYVPPARRAIPSAAIAGP